ncbi:MAG: hypothetical protein FJ253_01575 [Phycisphaerae bacterium]|nr:hypothetical protein [Phycisphaerae bacterium]
MPLFRRSKSTRRSRSAPADARRAPHPAAAGAAFSRLASVRTLALSAAWILAIGGAVLGASIGVPALAARADRARPEGTIRVHFPGAPNWMTPQDLAPLEETVRDQLTGSPFDQEGLRVAADGLRASGWFAAIEQVERTTLDSIEVRAVWVEPTALVRDPDGDHLIDAEGRLLPRSYRAGAAPAFPRIDGASAARPAAPGMRYKGGDVDAALAVIAAIADRPWSTQVAAIDVSRYRRDGVLSLRTGRDTVIHWGRAPGEPTAAEVPTRQKLSYLQFLYDHYGRIDAVGEGTLDVTGDFVGSRS